MSTLFIICTAFVLLVTVLPLWNHTHWMVRSMDFPRLQFLTIASVVLIGILIFLDTREMVTVAMIIILVLCLIWQLWWILPYTRIWPTEVKSSNDNDTDNILTIITSNVLTTNRNSQALIDLVNTHQPDILVTLESDSWWEGQLNVLESNMPYTVKCPLDNLYGMHLYSKLKLHDEEISFLVEDDVPSIHACIELRNGVKINAHFIHPAPPSPTENQKSKERDAELIVVARSVEKSDGPVVVTGDLNDVAWSSTTRLFRKVSDLLDPRIGRGMFNTFHADYPLLRWPLDHIFHSDHFTLRTIKRLPSIGSDHFPLMTSLVYSPSSESNQSGLDEQPEDKRRSTRIKNEENVSSSDVPDP